MATTIHRVDDRAGRRRFVDLPFRLYRHSPHWTPVMRRDVHRALRTDRFPFYEHSDGAFFLAGAATHPAGRLAIFENRPYNEHWDRRWAHFHYFDVEDDPDVAEALFAAAAEWASNRGLERIIGPIGPLPTDGPGILVEGFDRPAAIGMPYNHRYYPDLIEANGYEKETDYLAAGFPATADRIPDQVYSAADAAAAERGYTIKRFASRRELRKWIPRLGQAYNEIFVDNWEFRPITVAEMEEMGNQFVPISIPDHMLAILDGDDIAGHIFILPEVSAGLRRSRGRILPFGWFHILREVRRPTGIYLTGIGFKPEHRGVGANMMVFAGMARAAADYGYQRAETAHVHEDNERIRKNLENMGISWDRRYRIYGAGL